MLRLVDCRCRCQCHACDRREVRLFTCIGCEHRFCFTCVHRLDEHWLCVGCMAKWLGVMCKLAIPPEVERWFNEVTRL